MKDQYIQAIESYINDGYIVIPPGTQKNLEYNGIKLTDLEEMINTSRESLDSLALGHKLKLIPEGILGNIKNYIEAARQQHEELASDEKSTRQQALNTLHGYMEQIIAQSSPYLNLVDNLNYKSLVTQAESVIKSLQEKIDNDKKQSEIIRKSVKTTEKKSDNLLRRISSGVLSENFKKLGNSRWNYFLMTSALVISIGAFICLVLKSNELNSYLISSFEKGNLDYRVFLAKWSSMIPYLFLLSVGILELRSRIRNRDIYTYRENVAGSLDGYTESLLNRVEDIKSPVERDRVRTMVIEFMIDSMLELTKSPLDRKDKNSIGVKVKDIGEATISSN